MLGGEIVVRVAEQRFGGGDEFGVAVTRA